MALTLTFDFEDSSLLYHTGMAAAVFRDEDQAGRFDYVGRNKPAHSMPDMALALPEYDQGSLLWCGSAGDALLLKKIHEAAGHTALLLGDNYAEDDEGVYVVLTSWDMTEAEPDLTEAPVMAELVINGDDEDDPDELEEQALAVLNAAESATLMGEPTLEECEDHFHLAFIVRVPGTELKPLVTDVARQTAGAVGYNILSHEG